MSYGDRAGYARVDPQSPRAFAICDSCGFCWNRINLIAQFEYAGDGLYDQGFRDCPRCISKPQPQFRTVILPVDPQPINDPRPDTPEIDQNLNGFIQVVGPISGPGFRIVTELDPTNPLRTGTEVLASAATGWGLPQPGLTDRSGVIALSGVPVLIAAANASRQYLLVYNPVSAILGIAQGFPVLGAPATVIVGTGSAVIQNALAAPPTPVWLGAVYALGLIPGFPFFAWEG